MFKKAILPLAILICITFLFAGCSSQAPDNSKNGTQVTDDSKTPDLDANNQSSQDNTNPAENSDGTSQEGTVNPDTEDGKEQNAVFSIGELAPGDPKDKVISLLGSGYEEQYTDIEAYFGETFYKWIYEKGIIVMIGKDSGKVLEVECTTPDLQTEAGIKVGDTAGEVYEKYGTRYKTPVSRHSDDKLEGWFEGENGALIIFDMDGSDETLLNHEFESETKIAKIKITNMGYMD